MADKVGCSPKRFSLDVGCGVGSSAGAYDQPHHWIGVDIDHTYVRKMGQKYPEASFVVADAQHLPFRAGSFDKVIAAHVLEHVEEPSKAVDEIARVVDEGGAVDIRVPGPLYERLYRILQKSPHDHIFSTDALLAVTEIPDLSNSSLITDKWWASASILSRSLVYRVAGRFMILDKELGVWKPNPEYCCAELISTVVEECLDLFERATKYSDRIGITLFLNKVLPFEIRYSATKRLQM